MDDSYSLSPFTCYSRPLSIIWTFFVYLSSDDGKMRCKSAFDSDLTRQSLPARLNPTPHANPSYQNMLDERDRQILMPIPVTQSVCLRTDQ